jgi:hypothetical protein
MPFVYLIKASLTGHCKIGFSNLPERRLAQLQTGSSEVLEIVHLIETNMPDVLESKLHRRFWDVKVQGEWFALGVADIEAIKKEFDSHGQDNKSFIKRASAHVVRPLPGRQQHQTITGGQALSEQRQTASHARTQSVFVIDSRKHQVCLPNVFWQARNQDCARDQIERADRTVRDTNLRRNWPDSFFGIRWESVGGCSSCCAHEKRKHGRTKSKGTASAKPAMVAAIQLELFPE